MADSKFLPTIHLRTANWNEKIREPVRRGGSVVVGGGSREMLVPKSRIEQKWEDSEGNSEWRPLKDVFLGQK